MPMATYLYCVRSDPVSPAEWLAGIDGARVRALEVDDLVAWVSDAGSTTVEPTVARLKAHDAVCAAALESGETPLPVRFGQTFAEDGATVAGIQSRAPQLRARLARVAGCVELRVVVTGGRDAGAAPSTSESIEASPPGDVGSGGEIEGPGTAFLRRLARSGRADLARETGCEEARRAIRAAAKTIIVDQQQCETVRGLAYFPVLVRHDDVAAFRDVVTDTLPSQAIHLSVLGPFAPYSFAAHA